jgi:hypothetical protein
MLALLVGTSSLSVAGSGIAAYDTVASSTQDALIVAMAGKVPMFSLKKRRVCRKTNTWESRGTPLSTGLRKKVKEEVSPINEGPAHPINEVPSVRHSRRRIRPYFMAMQRHEQAS